jgi:hypothetical protein
MKLGDKVPPGFQIRIQIRVITKLPNTEQSSKVKRKTHKSINKTSLNKGIT